MVRLRILQVINSLDPKLGGTVEFVRQIGTAIAQAGHTVEVAVCGDEPDAAWLQEFPLKAHALGPAIGGYAYSTKFKNWLKSHGRTYDAWIINGLWQYHALGASSVARVIGIPYFVYPHGMLDPWNRRAHPFKYLKKVLYWLLFERATLESASGVLFTSQEEARLARGYLPSTHWSCHTIGNGIGEPPQVATEHVSSFRAKHGLSEEDRVLLFLSRIHPKKGVDLLLRAFTALSKDRFTLVIAGEGSTSYVAGLKSIARDLGIESRIRWVGHLEGQAKWAAFTACECFVLPSHQENFGIAVVEALSTGTPVCTTTAVNIHEHITEYAAGFVCRDDQKALAEALVRWQNTSVSDVNVMKCNARRCYEDNFQLAGVTERLLRLISVAASSPGRQGGNLH
jgi:glycosyltransferase involved in cell wall biosynthesis